MDIRQCKRCKKLFHYISMPICVDCADEIDKMFMKVRDYLYEHPDARIAEIVEKTGVPDKQIIDFMRTERLSLADSDGMLLCEQCGEAIGQGRYCDKCKDRLGKALQGRTTLAEQMAADEKRAEQATKTGRMHVDYPGRTNPRR